MKPHFRYVQALLCLVLICLLSLSHAAKGQGTTLAPSAASNTASATTSAGCTTNCPTEVIAISAGGPAAGNFAADEDFTGGNPSGSNATVNTSGVTNPAPESVYQHIRVGNSTYTLPGLPPGASYTVRLHFNEFFWTQSGQRVFNVSINGTQVLSNFDVLAAAGGQNIAIAEQFTANANAQGQIVIQFTTVKDNAEVSGIELLASNATTTPPTAPSNLTATVASSSQINLSWTASATSGATYTVLRNGAVVASGLTGTTYIDTGLATSTTYSYTVTAVDADGTSQASNTATATTPAGVCTTNCGADVIAISAGGPAAGNFVADEDFNGGRTSGNNATINTSGVTNPAPQSVYQHHRFGNFTYTLPGLTPGANYTARLHFAENFWTQPGQRVFNISINGTQVLSNFDILATAGGKNVALVEEFTTTADAQGQIVIQFITIKDNAEVSGIEVLVAPPVAPTNLTATATSASQINLSWTASVTSGATYTMLRNGTAVASGLTGTTYTDTGLTASTTYSYTVEAVNVAGTSPDSNTASATTLAAIPVAPSNLTATVASSSQINLGWTPSATSGVTYTVLRNGAAVASGLAGTAYTDTGLTASTTYSYTVEAVNAAGTSPVSNTATATTSAANPLTITTQPANQTANVGSNATFTVVAGGTGPFTYQWLKNGTPIAGATSASYTTPTLASTDTGEQFSVIVGNATSTVTSTAATLTVNNSGPGYPIFPGFIGVDLNNNTNGVWADNQIYVTVIGIDPKNHQFGYLNFDGTIVDFTLNDAVAPNHLTGPNGQSYGNYSFTLAQSKLLKIPTFISARAYISLGNPLYVRVNGDANGNVTGWAGPNPQNGTDPNINTHFDWYEFNNQNGIFINTTQVDEFGLPLLLDVWGAGGTFHQQVGITESIAQIDSEFAAEVPAQFQPPTMSNLRIFTPAKLSMASGGTNAHYFDNYIATAWQQFSTTPLTVTLNGRQFRGTTSASTFTFTEVNPSSAHVGEVFVVQQPSTQDLLGCAGTMATGVPGTTPQLRDENAIQLQLENQICSATNRGVLLNPANWTNVSAYYGTAPANFYSQFWHKHSIGGLAYGFSYDDNNNQSTTITTPQPEHMAFGIGW